VAALGSAMTSGELTAALGSTRAAVSALRLRLAKFEGEGAVLVTPQQHSAAVATFDRFKRAWVSRRRMVLDVVGSMAEAMEKKPAVVAAMLGLETDEDAKVAIKDF
jgi:hypothetical protein